MKDLLNINKSYKQFIIYFFVGGTAAIVEWITFALCNKVFHLSFFIATIFSFLIATGVNFVLGRKFAFKGTTNTKKEVLAVYFVSATGLLLNLLFMYILVRIELVDAMLSKIISTGLVFIWNYLSRKLLIYK